MAIGTLGAALIGGGLLGSAVIGSNASSKAGGQIADASSAAVAEQRRQFDQMLKLAQPGLDRANQAAGVYMQALGLGSSAPQSYATPAATMSAQSSVPATRAINKPTYEQAIDVGSTYAPSQGLMTGSYTSGQQNVPPPQQVPNPQSSQQAPLDVPSLVMQTPGYQAQLDQGLKAIDRAAPLVGGMYSGRRMKALNDYGQQTFGSYYNDWMNRVGGMAGQAPQIAQNIGQAGMQNAANIGGLMMTGANARANATMNGANAWNGAIGTGLGMAGGAMGWF